MKLSARMLLFVSLLVCGLITFTYMHDHHRELPHEKYLPEQQQDIIADKSSQRPIIVWWTGRLFIRREMSVLKCGKVECAVTKKRLYKNDPRTRGFIFYGTDFSPDDLPIPRRSTHEWGLVHEESPMNNYMFSHAITLQYFNHSCTFRRESDLPITTYSLKSLEYLVERQPVAIATKNQYRRDGLAPLLYVQSHCNVASDRDTYVRELMKYIHVDSYGACVHNKDLPENLQDPVESMFDEKFLDILAKYKFHLAFENAICDDYITEKLYRVFHVGSVPVYMGASTARDWSPDRNAIIMVEDFKSPADLAEFIMKIDSDDQLYDEYLEYKRNGVTNENLKSVMESRTWGLNDENLPLFLDRFECHVCEKIHETLSAERAGRTVTPRVVPYNHIGCPQPVPWLENNNVRPDDSHMNWTSNYWGELDKSLAMQRMIESGETDSSRFDEYWETIMQERH